MRLVAGVTLIGHAISILQAAPFVEAAILNVLAAAMGVLLIAGLWTPISGAGVAVFEVWNAFSQPGDPWAKILLGTLGLALALLGPGAWSVDARLFGWKRVDIRPRSPRKS
ncbi:MAG TPA: hypothetical protein VLJ11_14720 [Bryobacteraceae bacterium]|nr:hypothetical protein [Bryobacteraceae bacterium]